MEEMNTVNKMFRLVLLQRKSMAFQKRRDRLTADSTRKNLSTMDLNRFLHGRMQLDVILKILSFKAKGEYDAGI